MDSLTPHTKEIVYQKCESGSWLAWYKHREDIMANGLTKAEVKKNLKKLYAVVMEYESQSCA